MHNNTNYINSNNNDDIGGDIDDVEMSRSRVRSPGDLQGLVGRFKNLTLRGKNT